MTLAGTRTFEAPEKYCEAFAIAAVAMSAKVTSPVALNAPVTVGDTSVLFESVSIVDRATRVSVTAGSVSCPLAAADATIDVESDEDPAILSVPPERLACPILTVVPLPDGALSV